MREPPDGFLPELLSRRTGLLELILLAIFLALGVNLLSNAIPSLLDMPPWATASAGAGLCLLSLAYAMARVSSLATQVARVEGVIFYDKTINRLVPIRRYNFSLMTSRYVAAALAEQPLLAAEWNHQRLSASHRYATTLDSGIRQLASAGLVREAAEYYVLRQLATTLADHFRSSRLRPESLSMLRRDDVSVPLSG